MRDMSLSASIVALTALLFAPGSALAGPPAPNGPAGDAMSCEAMANVSAEKGREAADALFERGKVLRAAGRLTQACSCLEASNRLAPGRGGTLLAVGLCHAEEGKWATAYRELRQALAKARSDARADRETLASERLAWLEPKLTWLTLVPPTDGTQPRVSVDGFALEPELWSRAPLEVGTHRVRVEAEPQLAQEYSVVTRTPGETQTLVLPALESMQARAQPAPDSPAAAPDASRSATGRHEPAAGPHALNSVPARPAHEPPQALRTAALVLGIAGMAVSLGAGAWALERKGVVGTSCNAEKQCDDRGLSAASTGRTLIAVGTSAFVLGAVGFGAWAILPALTPSQSSAQLGLTARGEF